MPMPTVQGPTALHAAAQMLHFEPSGSLVADPAFQGPRGPALCTAMPWALLPFGAGPALQYYPGHLPLLGLRPQMAMPTLLSQPQANGLLQVALCGLPPAPAEPSPALMSPSPVSTALMAPTSPQAAPKPASVFVSDTHDKTLKRKQANRDSARRSRLRREAQVGEMFEDVDHLTLRATELQEELERLNAAANSLEAHNKVLLQGISLMQDKQPLPQRLRQREDELYQEVCEANHKLEDTTQSSGSDVQFERQLSCSHTTSAEGA